MKKIKFYYLIISLFLISAFLFSGISWECKAGGGPYKYVSVNIKDIQLFKTYDYGKNCNLYFIIKVKNKAKCWPKYAQYTTRAKYTTKIISVPQNGRKNYHAILTPKLYMAPVNPGSLEIFVEVWDSDYGRDRLIATFKAQPMSQNTDWINMYKTRTFSGKVRFYFRNR